ncbi:S26 family signal peptidase [Halorarum halobium]|uniref:S26 family signal peptidase n=1 Tax=Halorarum halobium TaxID=3075121 RepID=UPI0028AD5EE7|nr:S26 family signal peptidase [Halobaculum sp. XH14]
MNLRSLVGYVLTACVALVVLSLFLGQVLGQPVLLGYVETGSMAPTMDPGDGFVAVPMAIAGPVEPGNVIVFEAQELHGGGLTTHRVVGETDAGYVTRGDANPVTDQDGVEPPVGEDQVVAKALQVGGEVVVLPGLGTLVTGVNDVLTGFQQQLAILLGTRAVLGTQGLSYLLFAIGTVAYVLTELFGSPRTQRRRSNGRRKTGSVDARAVILVLAVVLVTVITASMVVPGGQQQFDVVSSQSDSGRQGVIPAGESENLTYTVPSNGIVPVVVFFEPTSEGISVSPESMSIAANSRANATVTLQAPPETGYYRRSFHEHRYLAVLPTSTIETLYRLHPWAPIVVIDALVAVGFVALAAALVGWGPIRLDAGSRDVSALDWLRRKLR